MVGGLDLAALHDERDAQSQARVDEALVQCSDDHDRGKCCALVRYVAVGQDCDSALFGREGYNSVAERGHRVDHCLRVTLGGVEHFEAAVRSVVLFADLEHVQVPEDRRGDDDLLALSGRHLRTQCDPESHTVRFTDAVERRVGDLGESLRKVTSHAAFAVAECVDGVAVTHGGDLFGSVREHRIHQEFETFLIQGVRHVALMNLEGAVVAGRGADLLRWHGGNVFDQDSRLLQQRLVVALSGNLFQSFAGSVGMAIAMIEVQHSAGLDAATVNHRLGCERDLSGFGECAHVVVCLDRA